MSASVLAPLTLGYRLLWNRRREIAGIELLVDAPAAAAGVDARHLLATLAELWPARAPQLLLSARNPALLLDLLVHG
ncbi:MAG: histidine kinase, partial [Curvibacter sp.]